MSKIFSVEAFNEISRKSKDGNCITFHFPVEPPSNFRYLFSRTEGPNEKSKSYAGNFTMELSGKIFLPQEFKGCFCDFDINNSFKSKDINDGFLGLGLYEKELDRFYFWLKIPSKDLNTIIGKWNLEVALSSDVKQAFGEEYWAGITLTAINFRKGGSSFIDGSAVLFDIKDASF